jgi:tripartite-type tricarboxylate transporter receptor subunit TctC
LRAPELRSRWAPIGLDPEPTTPEQFDKLVIDEIAVFTSIARAANIKAD